MRQNSNALPWLVTGLLSSAIVFLNLDGYQIHLASPWGGGNVAGEPPIANWVHGWPIGFAVRSSIYSVEEGRGVPLRPFSGAHGLYSRWPFDDSPVSGFRWFPATCNLFLGLLILAGTFFGTRKLARRLGLTLQFSLRTLLLLVFVTALLVAGRDRFFASRYVLQMIAVIAVALGGCMCVYSMIPRLNWRPKGRRARTPTGSV